MVVSPDLHGYAVSSHLFDTQELVRLERDVHPEDETTVCARPKTASVFSKEKQDTGTHLLLV